MDEARYYASEISKTFTVKLLKLISRWNRQLMKSSSTSYPWRGSAGLFQNLPCLSTVVWTWLRLRPLWTIIRAKTDKAMNIAVKQLDGSFLILLILPGDTQYT